MVLFLRWTNFGLENKMCTHFICEQESLEKVSRKAVYVTMCHFVLFRTPTVLKLVIWKRRLASSIPVFAYYFEQTIGVDYYWIYYRRQCCSLRRVVFKINRGNRWWNILNKRKLNTHVSLFTHQIMTCAQTMFDYFQKMIYLALHSINYPRISRRENTLLGGIEDKRLLSKRSRIFLGKTTEFWGKLRIFWVERRF